MAFPPGQPNNSNLPYLDDICAGKLVASEHDIVHLRRLESPALAVASQCSFFRRAHLFFFWLFIKCFLFQVCVSSFWSLRWVLLLDSDLSLSSSSAFRCISIKNQCINYRKLLFWLHCFVSTFSIEFCGVLNLISGVEIRSISDLCLPSVIILNSKSLLRLCLFLTSLCLGRWEREISFTNETFLYRRLNNMWRTASLNPLRRAGPLVIRVWAQPLRRIKQSEHWPLLFIA